MTATGLVAANAANESCQEPTEGIVCPSVSSR